MTPRIFLSPTLKALSVAVFLAGMPAAGLAASPDVAAQVGAQLQAQGYRQIETRRTLLGKVVVTARGHGHLREIVIDPRNGALLRDLVRNEGGGAGGSGIATVVDREDKDQDRDGRDDDDHSGSGSGSGDADDDSDSDSSGDGGGGDADDDSHGGDDDSGGGDSGSDDSGDDGSGGDDDD